MIDKCRTCGSSVDIPLDQALQLRFDQLIGWAKAGKSGQYYLMDVENVDLLRDHLIRAVHEETAVHGGDTDV